MEEAPESIAALSADGLAPGPADGPLTAALITEFLAERRGRPLGERPFATQAAPTLDGQHHAR